MYGQSSIATWLGVMIALLLIVALGLFAAPLFAILVALLFAGGAVAMLAMRRARARVDEPGSSRRSAVTREGQTTAPTGRASGEPASGEG
jgi:hypothetical protein